MSHATNSNTAILSLAINNQIKETFALFQGKRPLEKDINLYQRIYELCLDEVCLFTEEHLAESELERFISQLQTISTSDLNESQRRNLIFNLLLSFLEQIPDYRFRLE